MHDHHRRLGLLASCLAVAIAVLVATPAVFAADKKRAAGDDRAQFVDMGSLVLKGKVTKPPIWIGIGHKRVVWGQWLRIAPKDLKPAMLRSATDPVLK